MTPPGGARRDDGDPLVMSVVEAARLLGISKTLAYDLVARHRGAAAVAVWWLWSSIDRSISAWID